MDPGIRVFFSPASRLQATTKGAAANSRVDAAGDDDMGGKRARCCGLDSAACFVTGRWNEICAVMNECWESSSLQLCNNRAGGAFGGAHDWEADDEQMVKPVSCE